jgi:hypothetical protein
MGQRRRISSKPQDRPGELAVWRRAVLTIALAYALTLKLVFGGLAATDMPVPDAAFAGVICHDPSGDTGSSGTPHHHNCDVCCLACGMLALDAPLASSATLAFIFPLDQVGRKVAHAAPPAGPPVEAWSQAQPQRGPPGA